MAPGQAGEAEGEESGAAHGCGGDVALGHATARPLAPGGVDSGAVVEIFVGEIGGNLRQQREQQADGCRQQAHRAVKTGQGRAGQHGRRSHRECAQAHGFDPYSGFAHVCLSFLQIYQNFPKRKEPAASGRGFRGEKA